MTSSPENGLRKKGGRPVSGQMAVVCVRLEYDLEWQIDYWRTTKHKPLSRSEAIRSLIQMGLRQVEAKRATSSTNNEEELC
jgi:hypothetical protein